MNLFNLFSKSNKPVRQYCFQLKSKQGTIEFYDPFLNFLIYGGMGCGKTALIGKPLLREYLRHNFAGVIYDFKETDFTQCAYRLLCTDFLDYPYPFYNINFYRLELSHRTNLISPSVINDKNLFI